MDPDKFRDTVNELQKLNPLMPENMIEDLVRSYQTLTPEQLAKVEADFEAEQDVEVHMERCPDEIQACTIMKFDSPEEQDEYLRSEGKLEDPIE